MGMTATNIYVVSANAGNLAFDKILPPGANFNILHARNSRHLESMGPIDGIIFAEDFKGDDPILMAASRSGKFYAPVIAFSKSPVLRDVTQAMRAGAIDYLSWPMDRKHLSEAIDKAWKAIASCQANHSTRRNLEQLSKREREVLVNIADGCTSKEIGEKLGISERTVEVHRANMLNRLKAANTPDAIRIAMSADDWLFQNGLNPVSSPAEKALIAGKPAAQRSGMERAAFAQSLIAQLTKRELEILRGIAAGQSNRAIAGILGISTRTVEFHRANLLVKLSAGNSAEAVRIAIEAGMLDDMMAKA